MELIPLAFTSSMPVVWLVQASLAIVILWATMSLGKVLVQYHSDYQPISSLFTPENSTGFNAVYRISIGPVSIVLASIALYLLGLPEWVEGIWVTSVWFFVAQTVLLATLARWSLVDKRKFFAFHALSIALSIYLYSALISKGLDHLVPDEANLRTDLWLLLAAFFYGVFRAIPGNQERFVERKNAYVRSRATKLRKRFATALRPFDGTVQDVLLAVMIYEDFNRPRVVRWMEKLVGAQTQTIMQTRDSRNDRESIAQTGAKMTASIVENPLPPSGGRERDQAIRSLLQLHNPNDPQYSFRAKEVFDLIEQ